MHNNNIVIIFVVSKNNRDMKPKTKKWRERERELLYHLELYNELKGREGVTETLRYLKEEIDKLVELLKQM